MVEVMVKNANKEVLMINAEIHLTTNLSSELQEELSKINNLKIITIELLSKDQYKVIDTHTMITKLVQVETYKELLVILNDLTNLIINKGITILRTKIEVCPDSLVNVPTPPLYVETHVEVGRFISSKIISQNKFLTEYLLSRNLSKRSKVSLTYRDYDVNLGHHKILNDWSTLQNKYSDFSNSLEIEFCIMDTNLQLDTKWVNNDVS